MIIVIRIICFIWALAIIIVWTNVCHHQINKDSENFRRQMKQLEKERKDIINLLRE